MMDPDDNSTATAKGGKDKKKKDDEEQQVFGGGLQLSYHPGEMECEADKKQHLSMVLQIFCNPTITKEPYDIKVAESD